MSSPARSWSETTTAWASENCSRNQGSIMAVSSGRPHMFCVYQRGRGQEPVTVAGSIRSFVAVKAMRASSVLVSRGPSPARGGPSRRLGPARELDEVGDHHVLAAEVQVVGVRELLGAADLLRVLVEERAEVEEAEVDDASREVTLLEDLGRPELAQDRELHQVGAAVVAEQPGGGPGEVG